MEFLEKLAVLLVSIMEFLRAYAKLVLPRPRPPPPLPSVNDPETLQAESPSSAINLESSQPPRQPSALLSSNEHETLRPYTPLPPPPASSTSNTELLQLPSPTNNQPESSQQNSQPPTSTPTAPSDLKQLEPILAVQQHLQWKNSVLSFCLSYGLAVSLQYAQTDHHQAANQPNSSFVLLSFLVLVTFNLIFVALFISPSSTKTSELLEKVAFLVAAAAFCHAIAIPFPFELKYAVLAAFLLSLLLIMIFKYLNRNIARCLQSDQPILP